MVDIAAADILARMRTSWDPKHIPPPCRTHGRLMSRHGVLDLCRSAFPRSAPRSHGISHPLAGRPHTPEGLLHPHRDHFDRSADHNWPPTDGRTLAPPAIISAIPFRQRRCAL